MLNMAHRASLPGLLFLLLAGGFSAPAAGASPPPFTQVVVFGDSLCDVGNVAARTEASYGVRYPGPNFNYADGRFTDSAATMPASTRYAGVWPEQLAGMLGLPVPAASLSGGSDYAFGGATTMDGTSTLTGSGGVTVTVDDMGKQVSDALAAHAPDPGALYVLCGGSNDLLSDDSAAGVSAAAQRVSALFQKLAQAGAKTVLIANVPPLGDTPGQSGNAQTAAALNQASAAFRDQLSADLSAAQSSLVNQHIAVKLDRLDLFTLFGQVRQNPAGYGFTNITQSAQGNAVNADQYLFWDDLHPTTYGHFQVARAAYAAAAPNHTQILWDNANGAASLWNVASDGAHTISPTYGPYPGWTARAVSEGPRRNRSPAVDQHQRHHRRLERRRRRLVHAA